MTSSLVPSCIASSSPSKCFSHSSCSDSRPKTPSTSCSSVEFQTIITQPFESFGQLFYQGQSLRLVECPEPTQLFVKQITQRPIATLGEFNPLAICCEHRAYFALLVSSASAKFGRNSDPTSAISSYGQGAPCGHIAPEHFLGTPCTRGNRIAFVLKTPSNGMLCFNLIL